MRLTKTALALLTACYTFSAQAADNGVMVDLSVLDGLTGDYDAPSEPLFPIMPKAAPKTLNKQATPKIKATIKQTTPHKEVEKDLPLPAITAPDTLEEVVVVDVEPVSANETDSKESVTPNEVADSVIKASETEIVVPTAKVDIDLPAKDTVSNKENETNDNIVVLPTNEPTNDNNDDVNSVSPEQSPTEMPLVEQDTQNTDNAASLLIAAPKIYHNGGKAIIFDAQEDELTPEQMAQIDVIAADFKNEKGSKIAIYSYNADNGDDSFRKKRISLNRAIEIRSYLLKKGFKNFSIKVVNITEDSPKANMVEISEI